MSIDPLQLVQQALAAKIRQTGPGQNSQGGKSFAEALNALESQDNHPAPPLDSARAVAQLAQLRMLQGLFLDDQSEAETSSGESLDWRALAKFLPGTGQNVDRRYDKLQPTLLETGRNNGSEIDRLIEQVAGQVSLAPDLIRSVVAAESNFQPDAVSPAGARGLMQLMPQTADDLGVEDSFDPHQNLLGGSRYLKQLLDKYDGDLDHALAAYNWGQGNVDRKGLEQMPRETREYLARVKNGLGKTRS